MSRAVPWTLHGDETGLVKETHFDGENGVGKTHAVFGTQSRELGVDRFCVFGERNVAIATKSTSCRIWDGQQITDLVPSLNQGSRIRGLLATEEKDRLVSCSEDGKIEVRKWPSGELTLEATQLDKCLEGAAIKANRIAIGGKNCDLKVWDLETQQFTFKARNVPNDKLDMVVPIWITDVAFSNNSNMLFTSTAFNQIRAYDQRQRQPVKNISLVKFKNDGMNHHLNCIRVTPEDQIIVADIHGDVTLVDVMNTERMVARFKGNKGSVRAVEVNAETRTVACGGMDRIVRVYGLDSREVMGRCYVKQKITAITMACFPPPARLGGSDDEDDDDEWSEESENEVEEEEDDNQNKKAKVQDD